MTFSCILTDVLLKATETQQKHNMFYILVFVTNSLKHRPHLPTRRGSRKPKKEPLLRANVPPSAVVQEARRFFFFRFPCLSTRPPLSSRPSITSAVRPATTKGVTACQVARVFQPFSGQTAITPHMPAFGKECHGRRWLPLPYRMQSGIPHLSAAR